MTKRNLKARIVELEECLEDANNDATWFRNRMQEAYDLVAATNRESIALNNEIERARCLAADILGLDSVPAR